jgi:hypothetical protein
VARWNKHPDEGKIYRVAIRNNVSGHVTYYGPYEKLGPARGVKSNMLNSYRNIMREVPSTGWIEETQTQWTRLDG